MSAKLFIAAAFTALVSLFTTAPAAIAERLSSFGDRSVELAGRVTAVEEDTVRIQVDGGEEVVVRVDEGTQIQATRPVAEGVVFEKLACLGLERPVDPAALADLLAGVEVTVRVEEGGNVLRAQLISLLWETCGGPNFVPRDGADAGTEPSGGADGRAGTGAVLEAEAGVSARGEAGRTEANADAGLSVEAAVGTVLDGFGQLFAGSGD